MRTEEDAEDGPVAVPRAEAEPPPLPPPPPPRRSSACRADASIAIWAACSSTPPRMERRTMRPLPVPCSADACITYASTTLPAAEAGAEEEEEDEEVWCAPGEPKISPAGEEGTLDAGSWTSRISRDWGKAPAPSPRKGLLPPSRPLALALSRSTFTSMTYSLDPLAAATLAAAAAPLAVFDALQGRSTCRYPRHVVVAPARLPPFPPLLRIPSSPSASLPSSR